MKTHSRWVTMLVASAAVVLVVVGAASSARAPQAAQGRWVIRDLGTFDREFPHNTAWAINERGQVVGEIRKSFNDRAFLWQNGKLRDLGTLGGDWGSVAFAINESGQVAGSASIKETEDACCHRHAFLWHKGKMTDLQTPGGVESEPSDINERGQVVGRWDNGEASHAFLWQNGTMRDLGTLGGPCSSATTINDRGQIVGFASGKAKSRYPPCGDNVGRAFLWGKGKMRNLGTLIASSNVYAEDINERGQIVGYHEQPDGTETAFIWENGKMRRLGTLGGKSSHATAINENGQVVGWAYTKDKFGFYHAFLWEKGKMTDLGTFGGPCSRALAINDRGQVVREACTKDVIACGDTLRNRCHVRHAFVWEKGRLHDLGTLGGEESHPWDINERGQIVGDSDKAYGDQRAVLWTFKP